MGAPLVPIERIDHFVIPCSDVDRIADWYVRVLGFEKITWGEGRTSLRFGPHKINLQPAGTFPGLKAETHVAGSADFCLISKVPVDEVRRIIEAAGVAIVEGPVTRSGALGPIRSVYCRDPDGNLVEVANYPD